MNRYFVVIPVLLLLGGCFSTPNTGSITAETSLTEDHIKCYQRAKLRDLDVNMMDRFWESCLPTSRFNDGLEDMRQGQ